MPNDSRRTGRITLLDVAQAAGVSRATASLVIRGALLRNESRGAHLRKDVEQDWTPKHSPYGHTFHSLAGEGIEKREVPV